MGEVLLVVQVDETLKQLSHDALDLRQRELDFLISHSREVEMEVVE